MTNKNEVYSDIRANDRNLTYIGRLMKASLRN